MLEEIKGRQWYDSNPRKNDAENRKRFQRPPSKRVSAGPKTTASTASSRDTVSATSSVLVRIVAFYNCPYHQHHQHHHHHHTVKRSTYLLHRCSNRSSCATQLDESVRVQFTSCCPFSISLSFHLSLSLSFSLPLSLRFLLGRRVGKTRVMDDVKHQK